MFSSRAFLPLVLTAIMLAACLSLGTWQVQRLQWKQGLLAQIEARRNAPPISLHSADNVRRLTKSADNYRPLCCMGGWARRKASGSPKSTMHPMVCRARRIPAIMCCHPLYWPMAVRYCSTGGLCRQPSKRHWQQRRRQPIQACSHCR